MKNSEQEIIDLGFTKAMFNKESDTDFSGFVKTVLSEQSLLFQGRIGDTAYAATASPQKDQVKRAEACLTAAELLRRRINILLGNVTGASQGDIKTDYEFKQRTDYLTEATDLINKIVNAVTTDSGSGFASGALVTNHFGETE